MNKIALRLLAFYGTIIYLWLPRFSFELHRRLCEQRASAPRNTPHCVLEEEEKKGDVCYIVLVAQRIMETYHGHVRTPADAIILFEACRVGLLPRVQRRLSEKERLSIKSGSVFVWDEREAGMRRWTDGKSWSASRVSGSFLTYREMEGKRGGTSYSAPKSNRDGLKNNDPESADDGPDGYRYKPDGLMKQSFSVTNSTGQHLHLISYFARSSVAAQGLQQPSNDPSLRHIRPEKGMYPESTVNEQNSIPAVTRGPMTSPAFAPSPHQSASVGPAYGRGAPHYPMHYGHHPWAPPSPLHTPPPYSPYYHHSAHSPHPSVSMAHSPHHSTSHSPHPSLVGHSPLQQMHHAYPSHTQPYPPPLTAFDRAPAPLSNSTLPPPPPPPPPSSHPNQIPPIHNGHASHHAPHTYSLPSVGLRPQPTEQHPHMPPNTSAPPIDPNLSTHVSEERRRPELHRLASGGSSSGSQTNGDAHHRPTLPHVSSATTIPSISSLIHETSMSNPPVPRMRTGSRSPNGTPLRHTQDIPVHKMGYDAARDVQALRHLDKATLRF